MNKVLSVLVLGIMLLSVVSATNTYISGKVYNADYTQTITGADVTVTCIGETTNIQSTKSGVGGSYRVTFKNDGAENQACFVENSLNVYAEKDGSFGSRTGIVSHNNETGFNFSVIDVPLVPEFGVFVGALTLISAIGIFFFVRKK
jgi:hypothetical protein